MEGGRKGIQQLKEAPCQRGTLLKRQTLVTEPSAPLGQGIDTVTLYSPTGTVVAGQSMLPSVLAGQTRLTWAAARAIAIKKMMV